MYLRIRSLRQRQSQFIEAVRILGQRYTSVVRNQHRVRVTEPADAFDIDPRLDADHHVFGQNVLASQCYPGRLMPGDPETVSGPMQNVFPKSSFRSPFTLSCLQL